MRGHKCDCCSLVPFANFLQCSSLAWCGFLYGKFPVGVEKKLSSSFGDEFVGMHMGVHGSLCKRKKNNHQKSSFCEGPFLILFEPRWGVCRAKVGQLEVQSWAHVGFHGGLWYEKINPYRKLFGWGSFWGRLEGIGGLCRTIVGPFWVYVGPMLGHLGGLWAKRWPRDLLDLYAQLKSSTYKTRSDTL